MKKIIKNPILIFVIGIIVGYLTSVVAESIQSSEVLYDNSNSNTNLNNVQEVLDDVYNILQHNSLSFSLLVNQNNGMSSELIGGLYRFQGTDNGNVSSVNNYICFGTTNKSTCVENATNYMYRIIGIDAYGKMKLIKKVALDTDYQWNSYNGIEWPNSDLYNGLNGSYFLTNTSLVPSGWSDRIAINSWHYYQSTDNNSSTIMERELSAPTINAKIGLLYVHDYLNALGWMSNFSSWTLTEKDSSYVWLANGGSTGWVRSERSVFPVFLLNASEIIASGSGTLSDPYMLS